MHQAAIPYNQGMAQRQKRRVLSRRWCGIIAVAATIIVLLPIIGNPFDPWSRLNNSNDLIDINSGRMRQTRYLYYIKVQDTSESTTFSDALGVDIASTPEWHYVNTRSPHAHNSPHYRFHGALSQTRQVELFWTISNFTPEAKTRVAQDIVRLWKQDQSDHRADKYLHQLGQLSFSIKDSKTITVDDIAAIEIEGG